MKNAVFVELLTGAKEYLWDGVGTSTGKLPYICHSVIEYCSKQYKSSNELLSVIRQRLDGHATLSQWIVAQNCGVTWTDVTNTSTMQAHRLAWVNKLIKEFSA